MSYIFYIYSATENKKKDDVAIYGNTITEGMENVIHHLDLFDMLNESDSRWKVAYQIRVRKTKYGRLVPESEYSATYLVFHKFGRTVAWHKKVAGAKVNVTRL